MSVYDIQGNPINICYDFRGNPLFQVYDINGDSVGDSVVLKVMTYNVGQWYIGNGWKVPTEDKSAYYNLQHNTFANNPVDVLFLQEYLNEWCRDNSSASELISPFFDNQEVTSPTGYIGHSICTNGYTINNYTSHEFTTNKGNYPSFESATITVDGKTIHIINTHNDYEISYQRQEVTDLLAFISDLDYFILCGDFNTNQSTEDTSNEQYANSVRRFLDAGYHVGNCVLEWLPTYYGTSTATNGTFTDNIVTSPNIVIKSIARYTEKLTDNIEDKIDHLPLLAEVIIT